MYLHFYIMLTVFLCIYCLYYIRSYYERKKWVCVGKLRQIFIYPLEGGPGRSVQEAMCFKTGFQSIDDVKDRSYIAALHGSAVPFLQNLGMATRDLSAVLGDLHRNACEMLKYTRTQIDYLGIPITVRELHYDAIQDCFVKCILENLTEEFKIYYFSPSVRKQLMKKIRPILETKKNRILDGYASNFSSYTLINTKSLSALRKRTGVDSLSPANFRPHLVIDGISPYCEDDYTDMRIGNIRFKNIIPCTHTPFINSSTFKSPENLEPYATLLRTRTLNSLRPDLSSSNSPAFGINMELIPGKEAWIAVGNKVYVKYH